MARLCASYLAVFLVVLGALSGVAYAFFARSTHELLEPLLGLPEGQAAYAAALHRVAVTIALFDLPLLVIVGIAAYVLARFSVRPLVTARIREERFAADAAHELRTPLATIAALAQAARSSGEPAQAGALAKITDVALDAAGLIGNLLVLMREAPDDMRLHEPVDIAALLAAAVRDGQQPAAATPVRVLVPLAGAYVIGDVRALRQLVDNLLSNAARHAHSQVTAGVRTESHSVVLWVEDDGDGVVSTDRERIFERFYKVNPASPGSGLGLAICRHIVARHRAAISLEGGSRFVARFPRAQR